MSVFLKFVNDCPVLTLFSVAAIVMAVGAFVAPWKSRAFLVCVLGAYGISAFLFMCNMVGLYF